MNQNAILQILNLYIQKFLTGNINILPIIFILKKLIDLSLKYFIFIHF